MSFEFLPAANELLVFALEKSLRVGQLSDAFTDFIEQGRKTVFSLVFQRKKFEQNIEVFLEEGEEGEE